MTSKEIDKEIKAMRELAQELEKSPEKRKAFLHSTGMYPKAGNLKKQFR